MNALRAPLSFQQCFFWNLLHRNRTMDRLFPITLHISGAASAEYLERSVTELVRRHGALRTRIVMGESGPEQCVAPPDEFRMEIVRSEHSTVDLGTSQALWREADGGPLFAAKLVQLPNSENLLVLSCHHLVRDAFSNRILFGELWFLYGELLQGRPPHIPKPPPQYVDYARWQHDTHSTWLQRHAVYWQEQLDGAAPVQWPSENRMNEMETREDGVALIQLDDSLSTGLRQLASRMRTPLSIVVLGACAAVVSQWSGRDDFIMPLNVAGRHLPHHEQVVGYFAQFLFLRMRLRVEDSFGELIARIGQEFRRALSHQDFGRMATQRPDLLEPLSFTWVPWRPEQMLVPPPDLAARLELTVRPVPAQRAGIVMLHETEILFGESGAGLAGRVFYRTDRVSASAAARLTQQLLGTVERLVADPGARISAALAA